MWGIYEGTLFNRKHPERERKVDIPVYKTYNPMTGKIDKLYSYYKDERLEFSPEAFEQDNRLILINDPWL